MHSQKLLALICVAAVASATYLKAQSSDSDAQAKAREALRQKIAETQGQTYTPAPAPAATPAPDTIISAPPAQVPPSVAPNVKPLPQAAVVTTPAATPAPAAASASSIMASKLTPEQEAALRDKLRETIGGLNEQPFIHTEPSPVGADQEARAIEAERQAKAARDSELQATMPHAAAKKQMAVNSLGYVPPLEVTPPSAMVPGSKEQRLYDLLQQYKADRITPTEYHEQRAKILGEP